MRALFLKNISALEASIGYSFKNKDLLLEAITHKSYANENPECSFNERLEFLGDAILNLIVSNYLYAGYLEYTEAELSKAKAYAIQEMTLFEAARQMNLGLYLLLGKGEEATGGREKSSLLANAFEAIVAAIFLDSGLRNTKSFVLQHLKDRIETVIVKDLFFDFKTELQELVQARYGVLPEYRVHREEGPEHRKTFEVKVFIGSDFYGSGSGKSKKEAAQQAAEVALKKLK